jgi:CheY-like chemotaxis protein
VVADPGQLESSLLNIAINARDAMPEGGKLVFSCTRCSELPREAQADMGPVTADDFVAIAITDTGGGMPESVKERVFEPFFTTKEAGRGTGLGLSTVYGFAKQSKGTVTIDSMVGVGTTVTLYIPAWHAQEKTEQTKPAAAGKLPKGLRVLMVEDEHEVRSVVRAFLLALGCEVTARSSGEHALAALTPDVQFDLLITDIALGAGMRGPELAKRVHALRPNMAVLLMSGYASELRDAEADAPGARNFLRKPFSREDLAAAIVDVLPH